MNLIRYQTPNRPSFSLAPFPRRSPFQNEVEKFFDLPFFGAPGLVTDGGFAPALDLYQQGDNLTVKVEMPGMKREDFHLTLQDGALAVRGERRNEKSTEEKGVLRSERFFGKFERQVALPFQVDATRVTANYADGVLTVSLPKAEEAKPRQIEIH